MPAASRKAPLAAPTASQRPRGPELGWRWPFRNPVIQDSPFGNSRNLQSFLRHAQTGADGALALRYLSRRTSDRPAELFSSLASIVPSLSGLAAVKRFSTTAENSFLSKVPSLSGSAAAKSFLLIRPRSSRRSRVPS